LSRYTDAVLIEHAGLTETQVVRAVYPDCPSSEMDQERRLVRHARSDLFPRLAEMVTKLQVEAVEASGRLDAALARAGALEDDRLRDRLALTFEREQKLKERARAVLSDARVLELSGLVAMAYGSLCELMTFGQGIPWAILRMVGGHRVDIFVDSISHAANAVRAAQSHRSGAKR
jgi:hypothetical protein